MFNKLYWYNFVFEFQTGDLVTSRSNQFGINTKNVRLKDIREIKETLNIPENSIMLDCSYLGYMSEKYFNGGNS